MASTNRPVKTIRTHEGGVATHANAEQALRRSVMSCLLWESEFYEDGQSIAARISSLVPQVAPDKVAAMAVVARQVMHLRHVPLLLAREMARLPLHKALVAKLLPQIVQRADELTEFLALYWKDKRQPVSAQVKKGLAAVKEFDRVIAGRLIAIMTSEMGRWISLNEIVAVREVK